MKYLEKVTKEQCLQTLKEELEEDFNINNKQYRPTKKEIDNMISKAYEYKFDTDNEREETTAENTGIKTEDIKNNSEKSNDIISELENLNEKYKFIIGNINWNDISISNIKSKKLIYHNIGYFKSAKNYKFFAYFTSDNKKKKSKKYPNKRMCYSHIKLDISKKEARLTQLHEDECLIKTFGTTTIIPSMNKIIKKRDDIMEFGNKILCLNSDITLPTFKEIIYRFVSIKKYSLDITDDYLKNYYYNWKAKNLINSFYYAHDNPYTLDNKIFLQVLNERYVSEYNNNNKQKIFRLIYLIWVSPFHINRMRHSPHFYLDFTFIRPYPMTETLILIYIYLYNGLKVSGLFVLIVKVKLVTKLYLRKLVIYLPIIINFHYLFKLIQLIMN